MPTSLFSAFQSSNVRSCLATAHKLALPIAVAMLLGTGTASAATYTIQIGAFKSPSAQFADRARAVGNVYAIERASGVVALSVGSFASSAEANSALARIEDDYPGAFVRHANPDARRAFANTSGNGSAMPAASSAAEAQARTRPAANSSDTSDILATLSPSERKHVVYLDGVLHFKQGDQFLTLAEFRARNR